MGPLTVEQVHFNQITSAGSASAEGSRYRAVLCLHMKTQSFHYEFRLLIIAG